MAETIPGWRPWSLSEGVRSSLVQLEEDFSSFWALGVSEVQVQGALQG